MIHESIQRMALLLVVFGGFLELSGAIQNSWRGLYGVGNGIMLLGFLLGFVSLLFVVHSEITA